MPSGVVNSQENAHLQRQLASQVVRKISICDALLVSLITSYTMYLQCHPAIAEVNFFATTPTNCRQYFARPKPIISDLLATVLQLYCDAHVCCEKWNSPATHRNALQILSAMQLFVMALRRVAKDVLQHFSDY